MSEFTFELEYFWIGEEGADDAKSVVCEVDLVMTEPPQPDIMPSLNDPGEPGYPAEFEIHEIRLIDVPEETEGFGKRGSTLTLNETQFSTFFSQGQDVMNNAFEWAAEQEIEHDYPDYD